MITGAQTNLFCTDIDPELAFFGATEAFRAPREGRPEHVEVDAAGSRVGLTSIEAARRIAGVGGQASTPASAEIVLWCSDVDALHVQALAAGGRPTTGPADSPDGRLRYAWVASPQGHQVKLVEARDR